jgi:uroporphyrinogen decarboxylase
MTKIEKIRAAIAGKPIDTIPYSMWTHMPAFDRNPPLIAEKTYEFYKNYDVDIIKTMNNGMYSVEDYGCEIDYSEIERGGVARIIKTPINRVEDFEKLPALGLNSPALVRELDYLSRLLENLKGEPVPVIFTLFSPITTANKLSGNRLPEYIRAGGGRSVHSALEKISALTQELAARAITLGASGIFLGCQMSSYAVMEEDLYREYGKPYDEAVLRAASQGWCNVLHAHGESVMFDLLKDYPVHILNWHIWESPPAADQGVALSGKCIMGGIKRMDITRGNKEALRDQIYNTIKALRGRKLILAPGCVIRYPLEEEMLRFVFKTKSEAEEALKRELS